MDHIPVDQATDLTWDEFLALPYETRNASLIDGEVVVNSPNAQHEMVVENLLYVFRMWRRGGTQRGEVSTQQPVKISNRRGYQPDFAWYPPEHCSPQDEHKAFSGPPRVIVEVLSPSTRSYDLLRKRADYDETGIDEVWFIDGDDHRVVVCRRPGDGLPYRDREFAAGETLTSPLLPGFEVPVSDLFER